MNGGWEGTPCLGIAGSPEQGPPAAPLGLPLGGICSWFICVIDTLGHLGTTLTWPLMSPQANALTEHLLHACQAGRWGPSCAQGCWPSPSDHLPLLSFQITECLTTVKSVNKTDSQTLLSTFGVRTSGSTLISISFLYQQPPSCTVSLPYHLPSRPVPPPRSVWGKGPPLARTGWGSVLPAPEPSVLSLQSLEQLMAASRQDLALCPGLGPQKVSPVWKGVRGWR